ncbi:MAG TPA: hypothetical protein VF030_09995 [Solirubrobacterales bacterium]
MLAVLAMACFPGLAAADNSGIQYGTDEPVPTVPDDKTNIPTKDSGGTNSSNGSDADATGSNAAGGAGSGGGNDASGTGGGTHTGQGNQATGGGDGQASNGSKAAGDVGSAQKLATSPSSSAQSSDDGSSPLVPILIAVAVLAAISIGAYYYRQRRQGPGSTVSPKAS